VLEIKLRGFSEGYTVSDSTEREWSVKLAVEATTEVVASRIHWALGYHQPPVYLMREWQAKGAVAPNPQLPARFREKKPDFHGIEAGSTWSYKDNPFVGTREWAGLLVLQAIIANPDLKDSNNTIYTLKEPAKARSSGTSSAIWDTPSAVRPSTRLAPTSTRSSARRSSGMSSMAGCGSTSAASTGRG
jgi:hypothetical protein